MSKILLIIPPGVRPDASARYAVDAARREGAALVAVVVLDQAETARIAATLDGAFMGERVSDRVVEILAHEQHARAETLLEGIGEQARAAGVEFEPLIEEGDPTAVCSRVVQRYQIGAAVLAVGRRSWLARFLSRSANVKLPTVAGCDVKVIEEEDAGEPGR